MGVQRDKSSAVVMDRRTALAGGAALLSAPGAALAAAPASERLAQLLDSFMTETLAASPEQATRLGLDKGKPAKGRLDDRSLAGVAEDRARTADQLRRLKALGRGGLKGMDAVNYDTVLFQLETRAEANRRFDFGSRGAGAPYVFGQSGGSYGGLSEFLSAQHSIETREDADAYLSRVAAIPKLLDGEIERARHDAGLGVIAPDFLLDRGMRQLENHRAVPADKTVLASAIARKAADRKIEGDHAAKAAAIYEREILPALGRQAEQYKALRARATSDAGVWKLKDGLGYYDLSLKTSTTATGYSADAIHKLGLELTRQYTAQLDAFFKSQGLTQGTVGERIRAVGRDPRFLKPNTDASKAEILADLTAKMREVEKRLPKYFKTLPKTPVEVRATPATSAAVSGPGYYQPGSLDGTRGGAFYINLRDTAETPTWGLATIAYHEATPGHHLQVTLQQEAPLPLIRRAQGYSGYAEGWALYAEKLADEMGMYDADPWGRVGFYQSAIFRANRMVVDTGIHSKKWTRDQAIRWMADSSGYPETMTTTEVERYCAGPGQACSYMLGRIVWDELRDKARKALGPKFDMGEFHDAGLLSGAMPLTVLGRVIDDYIAVKRA
jgi:uncharacterized protein (DUF885 family)